MRYNFPTFSYSNCQNKTWVHESKANQLSTGKRSCCLIELVSYTSIYINFQTNERFSFTLSGYRFNTIFIYETSLKTVFANKLSGVPILSLHTILIMALHAPFCHWASNQNKINIERLHMIKTNNRINRLLDERYDLI